MDDPESVATADFVVALVDECWSGGDLSRWSQWYPEGHIRRMPDGSTAVGRAPVERVIQGLHAEFPGHRQTQRYLVAGGNLAFRNWSISKPRPDGRTNLGSLTLDAVTTYLVVDDRLAAAWTTVDRLGFERQKSGESDRGDTRVHPPVIRRSDQQPHAEMLAMVRAALETLLGATEQLSAFEQDVRLHRSIDPAGIGMEALAQLGQSWRTAFSGIKIDLLDETLVWGGDSLAVAWEASGHHSGSFEGVAATGREASWGGHAVLRLHAGSVAEVWLWEDRHSLRTRLSDDTAEPSGRGGWTRSR